jgi:subtilisin family serine protease
MWSPEAGKNLIAVTATTKTGGAYAPPSRGPCLDGRLKPDISAAGVDIVSTSTSNNGYVSLNGTSMAAPAISGTVGLMIQRYRQQNNNATPSPALIKSILLNTAQDIGNPGPDYTYGYGLANAQDAVRAIDAGNFTENTILKQNRNAINE